MGACDGALWQCGHVCDGAARCVEKLVISGHERTWMHGWMAKKRVGFKRWEHMLLWGR